VHGGRTFTSIADLVDPGGVRVGGETRWIIGRLVIGF
jgi:hypothetical protein